MRTDKKEVSPWIAVVGILLTLAAIQFFYWRVLVAPPPKIEVRSTPAGGSLPQAASLPPGQSACDVATFAGRPEPGYLDGPAEQAMFDGPAGIAVSPSGVIYVADSRNHRIRRVSPDGVVSTLAGADSPRAVGAFADGPADQAHFSNPAGLALAPDGAVLVADTGNHLIRRISPDGVVSSYAGAQAPRDDLGRPTGGYRDGLAAEALFAFPVGLAADAAGTLYVADAGNHCVRRISPSGQVTTIPAAAKMKTPTQLFLAAGGRLWVADTTGGALWTGPSAGPLSKWPGTREGEALEAPSGLVALDADIYVLDVKRHSLLRIDPGRSTLLAGEEERGAGGYADGPGPLARFSAPAALAPAPGDALYLADFGNNSIRRVTMSRHSQEDR